MAHPPRSTATVRLVTTNDTDTPIWSANIEPDSVAHITYTVVARTVDTLQAFGARRRGVFRRAGDGAVQVVGGAIDTIGVDKKDDASWDVTFAIDPDDPDHVYAIVKGASALAVIWRAYIEVLVVNT